MLTRAWAWLMNLFRREAPAAPVVMPIPAEHVLILTRLPNIRRRMTTRQRQRAVHLKYQRRVRMRMTALLPPASGHRRAAFCSGTRFWTKA